MKILNWITPMYLLRFAVLLSVVIGLSSCEPGSYLSDQNLLDPAKIETPFPANSYWVSPSTVKDGLMMTVESTNIYTSPVSDQDQSQLQLQFEHFRDSYYFVRMTFSQETIMASYMIGYIDGKSLTLAEFDPKELAALAGVRVERFSADEAGLKLPSRADLLTIVDYYIDTAENKQDFETFKVFDADDPDQMAAAEKYKAAIKAEEENRQREETQKAAEKKRREQAEAARLQEERKRPKMAGDWAYTAELDPFTDNLSPRIVGRATLFDGTPGAPLILFKCRANGLLVEMHWGVALDSLMEDNNDVHMGVLARFDSAKPVLLIMVPSRDRAVTYEMNTIAKAGFGISLGIIKAFRSDLDNADFTWTARDLFRLLGQSDKLALRSPTVHGVNATAIYDLSGFREVAKLFPETCQ